MKNLLPMSVLIALLLPAAAASNTPALEDSEVLAGPTRPDDTEGKKRRSDGLAECASILAVASTRSNNIVERKNMSNASASWFAASGDLAITEGRLPEASVWEDKVINWTAKIGSLDALAVNSDWMTYCAAIGAEQGLDASHFPQPAQITN